MVTKLRRKETHALMKTGASKYKKIAFMLAAAMVCVCTAASAQSYSLGDEAPEVSTIQTALTELNLYSADITGHFGEKTEAAVKKFQKKYAFADDGVVSEEVFDALCTAAGISSSGTSSGSSGSSSSGSSSSTLLKEGMESEAVRQLQENLATLGYYSGSVTGHFGSITKDAVISFQRKNGLSADGVAGQKTLAAISSKMSSSGSSSSSSSSSGSSSGSSSYSALTLDTTKTLQRYSEGGEVRKLQQMLSDLGYYAGNKTGSFGELTKDAVIAFQKDKGLTADGIAGARTLAALNAAHSLGSINSSGNTVSLAVRAASVLDTNFYNWRRDYQNGEYCTVYDFETGYSWTLRIMSKDAHMDAEPLTAQDVETMNKAFGGKVTWTPKPVWVTFSDGKTYIGATANEPHGTYHLTNNNFDGHLCVHFPIDMDKAISIGTNATAFQEAILEGWEKTQELAK